MRGDIENYITSTIYRRRRCVVVAVGGENDIRPKDEARSYNGSRIPFWWHFGFKLFFTPLNTFY